MSSPFKNVVGANWNPALQLVDNSGSRTCCSVLNQVRMPVSTAALPPPLRERSAGSASQPNPAFCNFFPPEPVGAKPAVQRILIGELFWNCAAPGALLKPQPFHATFEIGENSPKFGARKDVPQEPRSMNPASSDNNQLNAAFGLLVPPTSLYWS